MIFLFRNGKNQRNSKNILGNVKICHQYWKKKNCKCISCRGNTVVPDKAGQRTGPRPAAPAVHLLGSWVITQSCNLSQFKTETILSRTQQQPKTDLTTTLTKSGNLGCYEKRVNPKSQEILTADVCLSLLHAWDRVKFLHEWSHSIFALSHDKGPISIPILQVRKPTLTEVKIHVRAGGWT